MIIFILYRFANVVLTLSIYVTSNTNVYIKKGKMEIVILLYMQKSET